MTMTQAGFDLGEYLKQQGVYASGVQGVSMWPMLRPGRDTAVLKPLQREADSMDVVLYRMPDGRQILHRVLKRRERDYLILGDNCVGVETIPKEWVFARLSGFYRGERQVELSDWRYRLYVGFWCRPWPVRVLLLRCRRFLGKIRRSAGEKRRDG